MNIFEALRLSHDTQRGLATLLLETQGASPQRSNLFKDLKNELWAHAAAEERCFYGPLIYYNETMGQARHGMAEHHEMDEMIEELNKIEMSSSAWIAQFKHLHDKVYHHLKDEESAIFQLAGKSLTQAQKLSLAIDYETEFATFRLGKPPVSSAEE